MASLDISLDDMIKNRRKADKRGRGNGKPRRKNPLGVNALTSAIAKSIRRSKNLQWQNGLFGDSLEAAGLSGLDVGTKLYVSNLDVGVTNEDIRELFLGTGELIRYAIHFDKTGRPSGSAEVVFARRSDAFKAFKRYNSVELDGKPMKLEIIGSNPKTPVSARINVGGKNKTLVMASARARSRGDFNRGYVRKARGGSRLQAVSAKVVVVVVEPKGTRWFKASSSVRRGGGRGRGGARGVTKSVGKSADDLDKELESYHAQAMQS